MPRYEISALRYATAAQPRLVTTSCRSSMPTGATRSRWQRVRMASQVCHAIKQGLDMPREERWTTLMQGLVRNGLDAWRNAFLTTLEAVDRCP